MLNAPKVLALNVDALLISFICMLMLLILSLHQERSDKNLAGMKLRVSVFLNEISLLKTLTLMTSYIAFCLYLMNKMRGNLIKIRSCTTFKWFNWFDRLCIE